MPLRTKLLGCHENVDSLLDSKLLNEDAQGDEHGTSVGAVITVDDQGCGIGLYVLVLSDVDELDDPARHFRDLALDCGPAVVLILRHVQILCGFGIGNAQLPSGVIRTALALDVSHPYVVVASLVVRPISGTFLASLVQLRL